MSWEIYSLTQNDWKGLPSFRLLKEIPDLPDTLYYAGTLPDPSLTLLSVVGSRSYTTYGKNVTEQLIGGLRGKPIGIVSGLARGIDSIAHETALANQLYTLAIPGSGLDYNAIYPARGRTLADRIIKAGGGLLSEYEPHQKAARWTFPRRNRLMAGIASATLLVEAGERSGTLITARLTAEYNRELLIVPGSIFSLQSRGTHQFLKLGATPVTTSEDILEALQLDSVETADNSTAPLFTDEEQILLQTLTEPLSLDGLVKESKLAYTVVSTTIMKLELSGHIIQENGYYQKNIWHIVRYLVFVSSIPTYGKYN